MFHYLVICIVLTILSIFYLKLADKFNIIDKPNHRSSHTTPTIRGGGILFLLAILLYFFVSNFQYPYFVIGVLLIAIVSFIDDILTLSSNIRLPFQFIAIALCLVQIGFTINNFLILIPLLILGVGFINVYNFMDGINGITGFYSIVALLSLFFINLNENIVDSNLLIYSLFSLIIFGFYNFRKKARMFAGDIGSISIAVLFFFVEVYFIKQLEAPILLLLFIVYGADTILTLAYRKSIGERITEPHRKHIYQKLVHTAKLSHLKVALFYALLQAIVSVFVYFNYKLPLVHQTTILIIFITVFMFLYLYFFKVIENKKSLSQ